MSSQDQDNQDVFDPIFDMLKRWSQALGPAIPSQETRTPSLNENMNICDCGGLKTYKSLEAVFHSRWCSSQMDSSNP